MPCRLKDSCICTKRNEKVRCEYFIPSNGSRYWNCDHWLKNREPCPFKGRDCKSCEHYLAPVQLRRLSGKKSREEINRKYYERNKDKIRRRREQKLHEDLASLDELKRA